METLAQIVMTGLILGSMYALASVGLSLIYGTLGMFNMAHGVFMTLGAYGAYSAANALGLPFPLGVLAGMLSGAVIGVLTHVLIIRPMLNQPGFENNAIVATAGLAILLGDVLLKVYGGYPFSQPVAVSGTMLLAGTTVTLQSVAILVVSLVLIAMVAWLLLATRFGLAIRATAINRDAARLMGVRTDTIFLQVMVISGALAGAAGVLVSSQATLSPAMGGDPMLKAFVICVVAGLGNVWGAGICAFVMGLIEATVQYQLGVQFGFPVLLIIVIVMLIWRPQGIFGMEKVVRL